MPSKLDRHLAEWLDQGLISLEQHGAILAYERQRRPRSWVLLGFLALGATVTGIGIIALIAANWDRIPAGLKLGVDILLLTAVATVVFRAWVAREELAFEASLVLFMLLVLASIGLVAQVYHLSGPLYGSLLLWSAITLPAALASRRDVAPVLWVSLLEVGLILAWLDAPWPATPAFGDPTAKLVAIGYTLPVASALAGGLLARSRRLGHWAWAFRLWAVLGGLAAVTLADIDLSAGLSHACPGLLAVVPGLAVSLLLAIEMGLHRAWPVNARAVGIGLVAAFSAQTLIAASLCGPGQPMGWLGAGTSVTVLLLFTVLAGSLGWRQLFNLATFLVGLRFVIAYFQVIGSLAETGVGLVLSGLVIMAVTIAWYRLKDRLLARLTGNRP